MMFRLPMGGTWSGTFSQWRAELQGALIRSENDIIERDFDIDLSTDTGATITTTESVYSRYIIDGPLCHLWAYWVGVFTVSSPNYIIMGLPVRAKAMHTSTNYSYNATCLAYVAASGWQSGHFSIPNYGPKLNIFRDAGAWTAGAESRFTLDAHFLVE